MPVDVISPLSLSSGVASLRGDGRATVYSPLPGGRPEGLPVCPGLTLSELMPLGPDAHVGLKEREMTETKTFRCVALDQVLDPETFRRDLVTAYIGGEVPGGPANLSDEELPRKAFE